MNDEEPGVLMSILGLIGRLIGWGFWLFVCYIPLHFLIKYW